MRGSSLRMRQSQGSLQRHRRRGRAAPKRGGMVKPLRMSRSRLPSELVVDGQHQRVVAGGRGALGELAGEAAVAIDEDLHPARRRAGRGELLERADRAVAEADRRCRRRPRRARRQRSPSGQNRPARPVGPMITGSARRLPNSVDRQIARRRRRSAGAAAARCRRRPPRCGAACARPRRRRRRSRRPGAAGRGGASSRMRGDAVAASLPA